MGKRERWRDGGGTLYVDRGAAPGMPAGHAEPPEGPPEPLEGLLGVPVEVPVEVAASYRARTRGLLGRDGIEGAMLLTPASSVHTFRMRFPIDVAHLDRRLTVIALTTMAPGRLGLPRLRARHVLEAEAGAMAAWGLRVGSPLRVRLTTR
ncbi:DUF192 domain-containing protein [Streptomyces sp. NBC_00335]|uniref:DUF192 domain-containing protein n=1 Tax=unclassified Streptomyces TaxID=2593676 RepID=UPI002252F4EF|nr:MULTISPECIES: DUF192 domain-containing protein [unclassified Streptomyces]MCX5404910.1 DUF192 domain-containing protein [Streptomyces sp. NBC_00086]